MGNVAVENNKGLLDCLLEFVGCNYLSDMHSDEYMPFVCKAVAQLQAEDFGIHEWNDAVYYITKMKRDFKEVNAAKAFLETWNGC